MAKSTILITGASGNIGKATIKSLTTLSSEITVKAGVRDPTKSAALSEISPNVLVVAADPLNSEQISVALEDVDYVFAITPGHIKRAEIVNATVDAAKSAGVKFILIISVLTAPLPETIFGEQFSKIEAHAKDSGVPYAFLRLPLFVDNNYGNIQSIKEQGTIYGGILPDKLSSQVVVKDIGEVAAKILLSPEAHFNKTYKLSSPAFTQTELTDAFSRELGKAVTYTHVPNEAVRGALTGAGFEEWQADGIVELIVKINEENPLLNDPEAAKHAEELLGRLPTTVAQWVKENAVAFA